MELKHTNPNNEIVLASIINLVELGEGGKNESNTIIFLENTMIVHKTRSPIIFTLLIQMG